MHVLFFDKVQILRTIVYYERVWIHAVSLVLFSRQSGLLCSCVMPDPSQAQVPTATVPAAQAVLENSSADTASSAEAPSTVANQETLEVN